MYTWIWRRLPGGRGLKAAEALAMALIIVALLFFVIFPWIEPLMPFNSVTVN